jgi:hypothetical protein
MGKFIEMLYYFLMLRLNLFSYPNFLYKSCKDRDNQGPIFYNFLDVNYVYICVKLIS